MKVRALIDALSKQNPEADVLWSGDDGERVPVEGGVPGVLDGAPKVILAPLALPDVGGF